MRERFQQHHRLSPSELAKLWRDSDIAVDANVLLNVYRYPTATRVDLLKVLRRLENRLVVPHHAALEFYKNRLKVICEQRKKYGDLKAKLDGSLAALTDGQFAKSGFLEIPSLRRILEPAVRRAQDKLEENEKGHPDLLREDSYLDELVAVIGSRLAPEPSDEELRARMEKAKARLAARVPPGFRDKDKEEPERYGDALLWFELIEHAKASQRPMILVTDDEKDDWWLEVDKKKQGTRPELRAEMMKKAGVAFSVARPAVMLEKIGDVKQGSIEAAKRLTEELSTLAGLRGRTSGYRAASGDDPEVEAVVSWIRTHRPAAKVLVGLEREFLVLMEEGFPDLLVRIFVVSGGGGNGFLSVNLLLKKMIARRESALRLNVIVVRDERTAAVGSGLLKRYAARPDLHVSLGYCASESYVEVGSIGRSVSLRPDAPA